MKFQALQTTCSEDKTFQTQLIERSVDDLPEGDLLIAVQYSSLNYKDALSASGNPGVTRNYPHTPGIDAVGIVKKSNHKEFTEGDAVIVTGYDLGMNTAGGLAQFIRVPADWAVALPEGLSARQAMSLGTAGLTAGLCVNKLLQMGASKEQGPVLVTGATGGVGTIAVALLSSLGFEVAASTGKADQAEWLKSLGASDIVDRNLLTEVQSKPLLKPQWAHAVDCVGGNTLVNVLKSVQPSGSVACCGLVESVDLPATVLPFILRDINLLGVDSVEISRVKKRDIWHKFATSWGVNVIENLTQEVSLEEAIDYLPRFLGGGIKGRVLVNVSA
jgi:acrylyl-CoA reductase (NADPH)